MTQPDAMFALVEANPKCCYLITRDLFYRYNPISKASSDSEEFFVHVHYGNDDAGSKEHRCFNGKNLEVLVNEAKTFIKDHVN